MQLLHFVEHIPQSPSHIPLTEHFLEGCLTHHFRYALQPRIAKLTKKIDKSTTTNSLFVDFLKFYLWLFVAFSTKIPQIKWPAHKPSAISHIPLVQLGHDYLWLLFNSDILKLYNYPLFCTVCTLSLS